MLKKIVLASMVSNVFLFASMQDKLNQSMSELSSMKLHQDINSISSELIGNNKTSGVFGSGGNKKLLEINIIANQKDIDISFDYKGKKTRFNNIEAVCPTNSESDLIFAKNYNSHKDVALDKKTLFNIFDSCNVKLRRSFSGTFASSRRYILTEDSSNCLTNTCANIDRYGGKISIPTITRQMNYNEALSHIKNNYQCYVKRSRYDIYDVNINDTNININYNPTEFSPNGCLCTSAKCRDKNGFDNIKQVISNALVSKLATKNTITKIENTNNQIIAYTLDLENRHNEQASNKYEQYYKNMQSVVYNDKDIYYNDDNKRFSIPQVNKNATKEDLNNIAISEASNQSKDKNSTYRVFLESNNINSDNYAIDSQSGKLQAETLQKHLAGPQDKEAIEIAKVSLNTTSNVVVKDDILFYKDQQNNIDAVDIHKVNTPKTLKCLVSYSQKDNSIIHREDILNSEVKGDRSQANKEDSLMYKTKACVLKNNKQVCQLDSNETLVKDCNDNIDSATLTKMYAVNEFFKSTKKNNNDSLKANDDLRIFVGKNYNITEKQVSRIGILDTHHVELWVKHIVGGWNHRKSFGVLMPDLLALAPFEYLELSKVLSQATTFFIAEAGIAHLQAVNLFTLGVFADDLDVTALRHIPFDIGLNPTEQKICCNIKFKEQKLEFPQVLSFTTTEETKAFCDTYSKHIKAKYNSTCQDYIHNARANARIQNVGGSGCNLTYAYDGTKVFKKDRTKHLGRLDSIFALAFNSSGLIGASLKLNECKADLTNQEGFIQKIADGGCRFTGHTRNVNYVNKDEECLKHIRILGKKKCVFRRKYKYPTSTTHKYNFCCQESKIASLIMTEAQKQLKNVDFCKGLTIREFKQLDFNKMDLSDLATDLGIKASASMSEISIDDLTNKIENISIDKGIK